jgi:hypothetical protein
MSDGNERLPERIDPIQLPVSANARSGSLLNLEIEGSEQAIWLVDEDKPQLTLRLKELVRREKRRAASVASAASTAQQVGIAIGASLTVAGITGLATAPTSTFIGFAVATGIGAVVSVTGFLMSHWMSAKKFLLDEKIERLQDALEQIK